MSGKYRPSNGTEGEFFMERWCYRCRHDSAPDDFCPILATTMAFDVDDPEYPSEWVQNEDGIGGYCTAFEEATDE